jgi:hypothetical protein
MEITDFNRHSKFFHFLSNKGGKISFDLSNSSNTQEIKISVGNRGSVFALKLLSQSKFRYINRAK